MSSDQDEHQRENAATDELLEAVRAGSSASFATGRRSVRWAPRHRSRRHRRPLGLVRTQGWADIVGPCYSSGGLQKELGVGRAALSKAVRERRALRLDTSDQRTLYPAFQVRNSALVPGLSEVLPILGAGVDDPWTWAQWSTRPSAAGTEWSGDTSTALPLEKSPAL